MAEGADGTEVLVVDDAQVDRYTLMKTLEATDLVVSKFHEATCGEEALVKLDENPNISLMFTDLQMPPGMGGYQLAQIARRRSIRQNRRLQIVIVATNVDETQAYAHGADLAVRKQDVQKFFQKAS